MSNRNNIVANLGLAPRIIVIATLTDYFLAAIQATEATAFVGEFWAGTYVDRRLEVQAWETLPVITWRKQATEFAAYCQTLQSDDPGDSQTWDLVRGILGTAYEAERMVGRIAVQEGTEDNSTHASRSKHRFSRTGQEALTEWRHTKNSAKMLLASKEAYAAAQEWARQTSLRGWDGEGEVVWWDKFCKVMKSLAG